MRTSYRRRCLQSICGFMGFVLCAMFILLRPTQAAPMYQSTNVSLLNNGSFEAADLGAWFCNGCSMSQITTPNIAPQAGDAALSISQRNASWAGPNYEVTANLVNGQPYVSEAWVFIPQGVATAKLSLRLTFADGQQKWYFSANTPVGTTWTPVRAAWTPQWTGELTEAMWYIELGGANGFNPSFFVDAVHLTAAPDPAPVNLFTNGDFEVTAAPWVCRFNTCQLNLVNDGTEHPTALRVFNRSTIWGGPTQFLTNILQDDQTYRTSIQVRQPNGATPTNVSMRLYVRTQTGQELYQTIAETEVGEAWVTLDGSVLANWSGELQEAYWFLESTAPELLVDTARLSPIAVPGINDPDSFDVQARLQVGEVTRTSIALNWLVVGFDVDTIVGYGVFVNGVLVAETAQQQWTLTNLQPGTSYTLEVRAYNAAGVASDPSPALVIRTTFVEPTQFAPTATPNGTTVPSNAPSSVMQDLSGTETADPLHVMRVIKDSLQDIGLFL